MRGDMKIMISKLKKAASAVLWIVIIVLSLSLVSLFITGKITGKPTVFGIKPMIVVSESMVPTICVGDVIIGKPVEPEEVSVGNVVAYKVSSNVTDSISVTVVHRVIDITEEGFIFKGDNNSECDLIVYPSQILYKIIYPKVDEDG